MKIAIMQPYFLPYIGYFQLIQAVDKFVIYDDVALIRRGWINRNRILLNDQPFLFTLQLLDASQFKLINQVAVGDNKGKLHKTFTYAYRKAPYFKEVDDLLVRILQCSENNLARFIINSLIVICEYLGIKSEFLISSQIEKDNTLRADNKIIAICKAIYANAYVNPMGGMDLYSKNKFWENGIELNFIKMLNFEYLQFGAPFVAGLSIIDVMMFNSPSEVREMLKQYEMV